MKLLAIARLLFGAVVVVAVLAGAIYALRPAAHNSQALAQVARTVAAKTAFAPPKPLPTITPLPTPDVRPRVLEVASGTISLLKLDPGFAFEHMMSDGSVLAGNGAGKLEAVTRDGSVVARFTNDGEPALVYSDDNRYAIWDAGNHIRTYDAVSREVTSMLPAGAKFPHQLADGSVIVCVTRQCMATALIQRDGSAVRTFPASPDYVAVSADGRTFAWAMPDGMHVYNLTSKSEATYGEVQWVAGSFVLSADGSHLLYARVTGDNAVHMLVVDLKTGGAGRELYTGAPNAQVAGLAFTDGTHVTFTVYANPARPDIPGTVYTANIDGTQLHATPGPRLWSTCGPACGLPPASDVGRGGVTFWCQAPPSNAPPNAGCVAHIVKVDRAAGTVRDLLVTDRPYNQAVSPDGMQLAVAVADGSAVLHIIRIADGSERKYEIATGVPFAGAVIWFPDGAVLFEVGSGK